MSETAEQFTVEKITIAPSEPRDVVALPDVLVVNGARYIREGSSASPSEPQDCLTQTCTYYTHYALYYDPAVQGHELSHAAYHLAEEKCQHWQDKLTDWEEQHPGGRNLALENQAKFWETKVCA